MVESPPRLPSLNALRVFECAARHLNFTRAAAELYVTQGAVSRQIGQLEAQLETRLFHREGPKVTLTEAGRQYYESVANGLSIIRRGTRDLRQRRKTATLTVSVLPLFASNWLVPRAVEFQRRHPDIRLRLAASYETIDFDRSSDIDAAIRFGRGDWADVFSRRLMVEETFPVCAPSFAARRGTQYKPADLADAPLICMTEVYDEWPDWFEAAGLSPPDVSAAPRYNELLMLYKAAKEGQGIALGRSMSAQADIQSGSLVRLFDTAIASRNNYYFVCPSGAEREPGIGRFLSWLVDAAAG